jgi:chaperonin GroES
MKIKPIGDRVLLKRLKSEAKSKGGIFIPETAQEKTFEGEVVAVGDDKDAIKVAVKDKVLFDKFAGTEIKDQGEELLLVKMDDIIAKIG